jgi:hypothetical protein
MNTKNNERRARAFTFMLSLGMLAGVLIWAKLRLVTDIPRSALAVPEEIEPTEIDPESDPKIVDEQGDFGGDSESAVLEETEFED